MYAVREEQYNRSKVMSVTNNSKRQIDMMNGNMQLSYRKEERGFGSEVFLFVF